MAVINTGLLLKGARSEFFDRFIATPTYFGDLCTRVPSTTDSEHYRWLGSVPAMRQFVDGRRPKGLRSESFDVTNLKYEATLEVDRDEIADDQTGQIRMRVGELAQRAALHKDYLLGQLLQNGGSAGFLSYDGQIYFSAAHSSGASGSQDNDLTSVAAADNAVPTSAEFKTAYQEAVAAMLGFKDDQGDVVNLGLTGLVALVPPLLLAPAWEAMNAAMIGSTSNVMPAIAKVIPFPFIPNGTTTQTWYLAKTDGVVRPFIFQDREPIEFGSVAEGTEQEFKKEKYLYGVRARYAISYGRWQHCVRHVFTT
jgi:phage major head subunit gpT-like protein